MKNFFISNEKVPESYEIYIDKNIICKNSIKFLEKIKSLLERHDKLFWVDQGTLLGAIRDNDFISWEPDIDLSAWKKDFKKKDPVWKELKKSGFILYFQEHSVRIEQNNPSVGWRHIDIHLYTQSGDKAITYFYSFKKNFLDRLFFKIIIFLNCLLEIKNGPDISYKQLFPHFQKLYTDAGYIQIPALASNHRTFVRWGLLINLLIPNTFLSFMKRYIYKIRRIFCGKKYLVMTPFRFFCNFKKETLLNSQYKIPFDVKEYLMFKYSKDWQTPISDWIWEKEDGSVK